VAAAVPAPPPLRTAAAAFDGSPLRLHTLASSSVLVRDWATHVDDGGEGDAAAGGYRGGGDAAGGGSRSSLQSPHYRAGSLRGRGLVPLEVPKPPLFFSPSGGSGAPPSLAPPGYLLSSPAGYAGGGYYSIQGGGYGDVTTPRKPAMQTSPGGSVALELQLGTGDYFTSSPGAYQVRRPY
jgi:hypothetical protein